MADRTIVDAIGAIKQTRAQGDIMILEKIMREHGVEPKSGAEPTQRLTSGD